MLDNDKGAGIDDTQHPENNGKVYLTPEGLVRWCEEFLLLDRVRAIIANLSQSL
jgi:hypothetical protein